MEQNHEWRMFRYLQGYDKYLLLFRHLPEKVRKAMKDVYRSNGSSGPGSNTQLPEHVLGVSILT